MELEKTRKRLYIVTIVLLIYVLSLSIGYAFFSETLEIDGVASTIEYYDGTKLPHTPVTLDTNRNLHYTSNYDEGYTYATNSWKFIYGYSNALVSENWNDDTYIVTFDKGMLGAFQGKTITYNVAFTNPTVLTYTDGTATTTDGSVLSASNVVSGTSDFSSVSASIDKTSLDPNEQVTLTLTTTIGTIDFTKDSIVKVDVAYKIYPTDNGTRHFYFILKYDSTIPNNSIVDEEDLLTIYAARNYGSVTKVTNGYEINKYPADSYDRASIHDKFVTDLKANLEAGATYRLIRDYQGTMRGSAGVVAIRDSSSALAASPNNQGIRFVDFTLTQEQIDSIDRVYFYGAGPDYDSSLFTFIRIYKISD